jgi:hypothetical protein
MSDGPDRTKLRMRGPSRKPKPGPKPELSPVGGGPKDSELVAVSPASGCEQRTGTASQRASGGRDDCFTRWARATESRLSPHPNRGVRSPSPVSGSHRF